MDMHEIDHAGARGAARPAAIGPTRQLAGFVAGLRLEAVDGFARHAARRHVIDTLGAMIAGATQEATLAVERALRAAGVAPGTVPVPGAAARHDLLSAAYVGGTAGHGLELDDGYRPGSVHPGTVVVPAALSLAVSRGASGADFLRAVVAGYEAACRIAAASHPRARWRGFHNTGTAGVFGAAAAAASLLGFDAARAENAFGAAASSAGGLFSFLAGGDVKRTHPGHAAREGLLAALLTEQGLAGPPGVLEFREGYFNAYAGGDANSPGGEADYRALDLLAAGDDHPRSRYAIANCYMKPHACCRHIHAAIDAVLDIVRAEDIAAGAVESVAAGTYAVAAAHGAVGWSEMTTAQMSFPFVIATALARRRVSLADFGGEARRDPSILALAARVRVAVDPALDADYPRRRSARVVLRTKDGREFERLVPEPFGGAGNPLGDDEVAEKFLGLATPRLGAERAAAALAALWRIDEVPEMRALAETLAA
ncbi:MmgE/PrpD family protein [Roseomonas sp. NAR14]|uniref:MmgE/PrpD family protein n=1 Tax=Roseomonas acroporae TaxID=2937791 RepID=A0A9X2BX02_9PROT|nr:MmgE/PrpD family protein [Roseomonas acroporae]MCK8786671.1 MmgE/PrpD family protein [Roseomonas acroporae]